MGLMDKTILTTAHVTLSPHPQVYYESRHGHELIRVPLDTTLAEVLASQR